MRITRSPSLYHVALLSVLAVAFSFKYPKIRYHKMHENYSSAELFLAKDPKTDKRNYKWLG